MRALKFLAIAIAAAMLIPAYARAEDLGVARTTLVQQGVYVYTDEQADWSEAVANFPLREGDAIWVDENGRAEISIRGGTRVRLDYESLLEVLQLGRFLDTDKNDVRLFLEEGALYINNEHSGYDNIRIESNYSSVEVPEGAIAMVDVYKNGSSRVSVLKGHVYSQSSSGGLRVDAGSSVILGEDLYARLVPLGEPSSWERWNTDRDRYLHRAYASERYLPTELRYYASDFDDYGSWVYVSDYGNVWRPSLSVSVSMGWSPYRLGRWRWRHGEYVWISSEPWGWAPYHYGRWAHIRGYGWCWVPPRHGEAYWGPGYVGWVYTSNYVSWVPLAPHEKYYGYGNYGPNSVNIVNININKTTINNVYVNAKVKNAVTIVHRDSFLTGKDRPFRKPGNPFIGKKKGIGPPPDFRPDKEGKSVKRDIEFYKKPREERRAEEMKHRKEVQHRVFNVPKPTKKYGGEHGTSTPGAKGPERQGPERKFEVPSRGNRPERTEPGYFGKQPPTEREVEVPNDNKPTKNNERVITPPGIRNKPFGSSGRESWRPEKKDKTETDEAPARVITPRNSEGSSNGPESVITPSGEKAPRSWERPSTKDRSGESRWERPSSTGETGGSRWERPSSTEKTGEGNGRTVTPESKTTPPGRTVTTPPQRVGPHTTPASPNVKGSEGNGGGTNNTGNTGKGKPETKKSNGKEKVKKKNGTSDEEPSGTEDSGDDGSGSSNYRGRGSR